MRTRTVAFGLSLALPLALLAPATTRVAAAAGGPSPAAHDRIVPTHPAPAPRAVPPLRVHQPSRPPAAAWPAAAAADIAVSSAPARVGPLIVHSGRDGATPAKVRVRLLDHQTAVRAGVAAVLGVSRVDGLAAPGRIELGIDYSGFRDALGGGDAASRLALIRLTGCAPTDLAAAGCRASLVHADNNLAAGRLTAEVDAASTETAFVIAAAASGSTGNYTATSLSPSSSWTVSTSSGDLTWSYPLRVPPVPGGQAPALALSYNSGGVDGRTASTNNQPSWLGEGWDLASGFIERRYRACVDDGVTGNTGDLCWGPESLAISFNGRSSELIRDDSTGAYHPKDDDGSKVERLTDATNPPTNGANGDEHWKVTTLDGTQYFFGLNHLPGWVSGKPATNSAWTVPVYGNGSTEPCHGTSFDTSSCAQAWRWNLDYVLDPHGNAVGYFYTPEANKYGHGTARTAVGYTRGGTLAKISYGFRDGQAFGTPAAQITFTTAERCKTAGATCTPTAANAANYPDVPLDQLCTASPCGTTQTAPTFWSTRELTGIAAQIWNSAVYTSVDTWSLGHDFPVAGDPPTTGPGSASLWLSSVQHSGAVGGTASTPPMTFDGIPMANRVDGLDGLPALKKFRLTTVHTETGGQIDVNFAPTNCVRTALPVQDTNTQRCFPAWWTPVDPPQAPLLDWFHKYVVSRVIASDTVTDEPAVRTDYTYDDDPGGAWHYNDTDEITPLAKRTWSQWRGYQTVTVTQGTGQDGPRTSMSYLYLRGMNGDKLSTGTRSVTVTDSQGGTIADAPALAGFVREQITTNGVGGAEVSGQINDPWQPSATATRAHDSLTVTANMVNTAGEHGRVRLASGAFRRTDLSRQFDPHGQPTVIDDRGDTSTAADDLCTRTTYAGNSAKWMWSYPSKVATVGVACTATPSYPADAVSDVRSYYDLSTTVGALTGAGDVTKTEQAASYSGSTPTYAPVSSATYDAFDRPLSTKDALGRETKTAYTETNGLTTQTVVTDPALFVTTTTLNPAWGVPTIILDPNGKTTELAYDPLGRLVSAWKPSRPRATFDPTQTFAYDVHNNAPTTVTSATIGPNGRMRSTYTIYDGLLRQRQTQAAAVGGGRILTDTTYNSAGQAFSANGPYVTAGTAGTVLAVVDDNQVPTQTLTQYDGAGRPTASIFQSLGREEWRTTTAYGGDHVDVTPPEGGTATTTYTDARGRSSEQRQYHGATPTGAFDSTRYTYTDAGQLATVTDPAGNVWQYGYDVRGRQTSADDPDKGHSSSTYDDAAQMLTTTDSRGNTLAYSYDVLGRKTGEFNTSTSGTKLAGWTYDTLRKGALTSSSRFVGTAEYKNAVLGYTADGQPFGDTVTIPDTGDGLAGSYLFRMLYGPDGSMTNLLLPITPGLPNESLTYQYDDFGDQSVLESGQPVGIVPLVPSALYTQLGKPARFTLSTGPSTAWLSYYYEESTQRLTRSLVETGGNPTPTSDTDYGYDHAGNVTRVDSTIQGGQTDTQCFDYDYLRRLTEAWTQVVPTDGTCAAAPSTGILAGPMPYWQSYGYDLTGNRTSDTRHDVTGGADTTRTYTYPAAGQPQPHAVQSVDTAGPAGPSTAAYGYDSTGNTTARPGETLGYDLEGHLASVTQGTATSSYVYDADGGRLISHDPTGATAYLPFGVEVHADTAGMKSSTRYYTFGGLTVAMRTTAGVFFLGSDPHGSSTQTVSAAAAAITTRRLDPFGNPRGAQPTWPGNHGFVNGPADPTGLTHLGAREYDPTLGRFTSVDPILDPADPQQLNGFAYANNSPVTNADPTGLLCTNGPDGMCRTKNGNVPTPGLSEQGAVSTAGGGASTKSASTGGGVSSQGGDGAPVYTPAQRKAIVKAALRCKCDPRLAVRQEILHDMPYAEACEGKPATCMSDLKFIDEYGPFIAWFVELAMTALAMGVDSIPAAVAAGARAAAARVAAGTGVAAETAGNELPALTTTDAQIQEKFKHAADFGVYGTRSRAGFDAFDKVVHSFVEDSSTVRISGSYRKVPAILNYNPTSRLVVVQKPDGAFVTGWRMSPAQFFNVTTYGKLGGG